MTRRNDILVHDMFIFVPCSCDNDPFGIHAVRTSLLGKTAAVLVKFCKYPVRLLFCSFLLKKIVFVYVL